MFSPGNKVFLIVDPSQIFVVQDVRGNNRLDLYALTDNGDITGELLVNQSPYQFKSFQKEPPSDTVLLLEAIGSDYRRNVELALRGAKIEYKLKSGGRDDIYLFKVAKKDYEPGKKAIKDFYAKLDASQV